MESNPTFQLEPVSPADRAAQVQEKRRATREANRRAREIARQAGIKQVAFSIDSELIQALDAMQARAGLPNRSTTLAQLLAGVIERPHIQQELGL